MQLPFVDANGVKKLTRNNKIRCVHASAASGNEQRRCAVLIASPAPSRRNLQDVLLLEQAARAEALDAVRNARACTPSSCCAS